MIFRAVARRSRVYPRSELKVRKSAWPTCDGSLRSHLRVTVRVSHSRLPLVSAPRGRFRRVVRLPFDSGPLDQSRDRRDVPICDSCTATNDVLGAAMIYSITSSARADRIGRTSFGELCYRGFSTAGTSRRIFSIRASTARACAPARFCGGKTSIFSCGGTPRTS